MAATTRTSTSTRTHRRRDRPDPRKVTAGGVLVILVTAILIYLGTQLVNGVPGKSYKTVYVSVPQVGNLLPHDPVRIAGVRVGQVIGREIGPDERPRIELQLGNDTKLPADTTVRLRANGLLGARYVQLIPGRSADEMKDGATIRGGDPSFTYGVPEALETFDTETRGGLGSMIDNLGEGLLGHGAALNRALQDAAGAVIPYHTMARAILRREGAAARLVPALDAAVGPLDRNRRELGYLNGVTADALSPFVTERAQVRATLDKAPGGMGAITAAVPSGVALVDALHALSDSLNRTLPTVPAGLRNLTAMLRDSHGPLARARTLLTAVDPAVPAALRITSSLSPVLSPVKKMLDVSTPILDEVGRHGCDIETFGASMRSMTGYQQPGPPGPVGPRQAFRLQAVIPVTTDGFGLKDPAGLLKRDTYSPPCRYPSTPYTQFVPGAATARAGR